MNSSTPVTKCNVGSFSKKSTYLFLLSKTKSSGAASKLKWATNFWKALIVEEPVIVLYSLSETWTPIALKVS